MKLFAVGTSEPNPAKWNVWDEVELYIAESLEKAVEMAGYHYQCPACEVDMTIEQSVMDMPPYIEDYE